MMSMMSMMIIIIMILLITKQAFIFMIGYDYYESWQAYRLWATEQYSAPYPGPLTHSSKVCQFLLYGYTFHFICLTLTLQ